MKKNILILIWTLEQWWWAEKVAATIGNEFTKLGYNIHFITYYNSLNNYPVAGRLKCYNEKMSQNILVKIFKLLKRSYNISRYCKKNDIGTSISFMEDINFCNIFSKFLFKNKAKIIVSIHNNVNKISWTSKTIIKFIYNFSDNIVTVVREEKENLIKNFNINEELIKVIYNPIVLSDIRKLGTKYIPKDISPLFEDASIFTFINIWRLIKVKNQKLLIKAFKIFNKIHPNSQLIIIWEWELRSELEFDISNSQNIHLIWFQKNPYNFLKKSNCFLFSSINEGFWIVLTEALACWLPIISCDCPTWPKEILRENTTNFVQVKNISFEKYWILVPNTNVNLFLEAMEYIYTDTKLLNSYTKKSKTRAENFDINTIISEWCKII